MKDILASVSKTLALLIFITGSIYGIVNKDPDLMFKAWSVAAGLVGIKTALVVAAKKGDIQ